jgi:hypothetical protein
MQWKVPIDDSNGEKLTCKKVSEGRASAKRNRKRLVNRKRRADREEFIKNTPFAEDANKPIVPVHIVTEQKHATIDRNEI